MSVRAAVPADLEAVVKLEQGAAEAPHWRASVYQEMLEDAGTRRVFVWEDAGPVQGFAVGAVVAGDGEIENVVVAAEARRAGVGHALCGAVLAWCAEMGAGVVRLEVRESNAGAIRLYLGLGFAVVGRRGRYYREPVEDALVMRLDLPPGSAGNG